MSMTASRMRRPPAASTVTAIVALILTGCGGTAPSGDMAGPNRPAPAFSGIPVPVLNVGDPFPVDLPGDGRATVTIVATEVSARPTPNDPDAPAGKVQLVVTVAMVLDKAGKPITGGPHNFLFRDANLTFHPARADASAFGPGLPVVSLSTTGQRAGGRIAFDVPPDLVRGGQIQLVTGRLVHAIWRV